MGLDVVLLVSPCVPDQGGDLEDGKEPTVCIQNGPDLLRGSNFCKLFEAIGDRRVRAVVGPGSVLGLDVFWEVPGGFNLGNHKCCVGAGDGFLLLGVRNH